MNPYDSPASPAQASVGTQTGWKNIPKPTKVKTFRAQVELYDKENLHQRFSNDIDIEIKAKLANQLAHDLFNSGFIQFQINNNLQDLRNTVIAEVNVAPAKDYTMMVSDYVFTALGKNWSFVDVEKALLNTYPEKFL